MTDDASPPAPAPDDAALLGVALRAYRLKDEPRSGWVLRGVTTPESVAAHSWGTALLCLLFAGSAGVDRDRALAIAAVHDLAEAEVGDIPARAHPDDRTLSPGAKARLEADGLEQVLAGAPAAAADEVRALWRAYESDASPEARFVRDMNLVDMALQALIYQQQGRYDASRPLPSRDGHRHLDEFFVSARQRLQSDLARRLLASIEGRYRRVRDDPAG